MSAPESRRLRRELFALALIALLSTLPFWLSDADLRVAALFYHPESPEDAWPLQHGWLWDWLFVAAGPVAWWSAVLAFGVAALGTLVPRLRRARRAALYVGLVVLLGPGLLVNVVLKDHWGRPRPRHVMLLGGEYAYVPPLKPARTPDKSFVCGHCAVGFSLMALYYLLPEFCWWGLALGLAAGGTLGWMRMSAGAHFLSDVLWSGIVVFLVTLLLYHGWYGRSQAQSSTG